MLKSDEDFILATAHFVQAEARKKTAHRTTREWAEYAVRRVREIRARRAAETRTHTAAGAAREERG